MTLECNTRRALTIIQTLNRAGGLKGSIRFRLLWWSGTSNFFFW
jgi:hypothetical protein